MTYKLYGSQTSPFVRRLRLILGDIPYEFSELNIFEKNDAAKLLKLNPVNQIPLLEDGDLKIWDSRQIFNYLNAIHRFQNMDWQDENILTAIDGLLNTGINLGMMKRMGVDTTQPAEFFSRQRARLESILDYLRPHIEGDFLEHWNFHSISLFSFLEWALFRDVISLEHRPECVAFLEKYRALPATQQTALPKA